MKREKEKALCTTLFDFPTHYIKKSATKTLNHMTGILYKVDSFHHTLVIAADGHGMMCVSAQS